MLLNLNQNQLRVTISALEHYINSLDPSLHVFRVQQEIATETLFTALDLLAGVQLKKRKNPAFKNIINFNVSGGKQ